MFLYLLLCFISSAKKITIKPKITSSAFNRTKGFAILEENQMVSPGKDSGVSGFAKTVNYYNHTSKTVNTASVWFVKGGTLMTDMIATVYRIDESGNSFPILGPVTIPGEEYKTGYVLQPVMNFIEGKYVLYFLHVTKSRMTFNEIHEKEFISSPTINSGMLQIVGKELLSFEEDYVLHAFIPEIGSQGVMIFRQPLLCVPPDPEFFACLPLLSFDIKSRTFSQVMVPEMLTGRENKLQDPVYTITVDNKRRRVVLVSKLTYKRSVGQDEVYKYQYISYDCPIWYNSVRGAEGIPEIQPSYYTSYERNLTKPNEVHFINYEDQLPFSKKLISSKSSQKSAKAEAFAFERKILFYQEASLSTHTIRTTNNGFCIGDYCTVPYQVPCDWGRNGKYESQDIRADYSDRHGIRVIKISDTPDKQGTYVTHHKDPVAFYLNMKEIADDQSLYSKFAQACTIEFIVPPVTNENGVVTFTSLPLQVVYRCRQNFMTYTISIDPNQIEETEVEDELSIGVPADINFIPSREILYLFDSENPKEAKFSKQTESLLVEYEEVVNKYDNIAYFVDYDFYNSVHTTQIGQLKFIDRQVLQEVETTQYKDAHIKLNVIPLPEGQSAIFIDQIGKKEGIQSPRFSSSFEIVGVDNNKRSSLEWRIDQGNNQDMARYFEREFRLKNCDLTFYHPDAYGTVTVEMRGNAYIENSRISMKDPKHTLELNVYKAISMDCRNLADNVKIKIGEASAMSYEYKNGNRLFYGAGQSRYISLGRNMVGLSTSHPNEKDVKKIELTNIDEDVVIEQAYQFDAGYQVDILYFSDDSVNGIGFPNTKLVFNADHVAFRVLKINIPNQLPYQNNERLEIELINPNNKQISFDLNISHKCPIVMKNTPLKASFTTATLIPTIEEFTEKTISLMSTDGNCEIVFLNDGYLLKAKGRSVKLSTIKNITHGDTYMLLKLSVDPKCKKVGHQVKIGGASKKFVLGTGWNRTDIDGTYDIGNNFLYHYPDQTLPSSIKIKNEYFKPISELDNNKFVNTTFPEDLPEDPTLCITDKDGKRQCSTSLEDVIKDQETVNIDVLESQEIDGSAISQKSVTFNSANSANKLTINGDSKLTVKDLTISNSIIEFNTESSEIQLESTNGIRLENIPQIISEKPVKISSPSIILDTNLFETKNSWKGEILTEIPQPTISNENIKFELSTQNEVNFANGVSISNGKNELGLVNTKDYDIHVKTSSKKLKVSYGSSSSSSSILQSQSQAQLLSGSNMRILEVPKDSNIELTGLSYNTIVKSKEGICTVKAEEGTFSVDQDSKVRVGFNTLQLIDNLETASKLIVDTKSESQIGTTVFYNDGSVKLVSGSKAFNISSNNTIEINIQGGMNVEYESEKAKDTKIKFSGEKPFEQPFGAHDPSSGVSPLDTPTPNPIKPTSNPEIPPSAEDSGNIDNPNITQGETGNHTDSGDNSDNGENNEGDKQGLTTGAVAGIVIGVIVVVAVIVVVVIIVLKKKGNKLNQSDSSIDDQQDRQNQQKDIKEETKLNDDEQSTDSSNDI